MACSVAVGKRLTRKDVAHMALDSTIAGTWYPGTEQGIRSLAEKWEAASAAKEAAAKAPNVLILPHAGWA